MTGFQIGLRRQDNFPLFGDQLEFVFARGAIPAQHVVGMIHHRAVGAPRQRPSRRGRNVLGLDNLIVHAGQQRAAPFAARDEHFGRDAACGQSEFLPGVRDAIGDFVAVENAQSLDGGGVKTLKPLCPLTPALSPDGGEGVRIPGLRCLSLNGGVRLA